MPMLTVGSSGCLVSLFCSSPEGVIKLATLTDKRLGALSTDAASELDVLGHDGHTLGVDSAQVGVLEETNEVGLRCLLECEDGRALETEISLEILSNLADKALERELADEELSGLLVAADLTESHSSWTVAVGLLDSSSGRC